MKMGFPSQYLLFSLVAVPSLSRFATPGFQLLVGIQSMHVARGCSCIPLLCRDSKPAPSLSSQHQGSGIICPGGRYGCERCRGYTSHISRSGRACTQAQAGGDAPASPTPSKRSVVATQALTSWSASIYQYVQC
ncbi:hypothetical protein BGZ61DRAFT_150595 [Ilyonectria robusta]|uniref:uncharacterized protein n=1 Tax=Ilyonectria robusta TaxID=1079257 RepID=UPI001E8DA2B2|nr:uncharacterized protein BGZ61DRAFT_150595 [Ilyonectria robusta]KAH8661335.1 hypothetical protein BGZ61DRAFT_150595 [Ilyonectria robusta]